MQVIEGRTGKYLDRTNSQLYKELEIINLKELSKSLESDKREKKSITSKLLKIKCKVTNNEPWKKKPQTQIILFQRAMKLMLICGQCIGLNPVIEISSMDISKMRFKYLSFRFIYSTFIFVCQACATALCVYRFMHNTISITILAFISFYCSTALTTFLFLRIAAKWPGLMKDILNCSLDKYVDMSLQTKCYYYTAVLLVLALLEHLLSQSAKISHSILNNTGNSTVYEGFLELSFPWYTELGVPFNIPTGIVLQFVNVTSTVCWSYSDVFLVCMSLYLASILNQINKKIHDADKRFYHPSFWSSVREDYTKATQLISSFDQIISGVMLTSFASNLFFICLQLFHVLAHVLQGEATGNINSPLSGSENMVYFMFSFIFVLSRFLVVSFVAASVHTASLAPAPDLYSVPSAAYCSEVQRFLEQIHGSTVALTGLQFFYVTRGLILSVAGTIVTYELVLLQFNGEDGIKS